MNYNELVKELKKEAGKDELLRDVLVMLSLRERPRSTLTIVGIQHMMRKVGINRCKSTYIPIIQLFNKLGVGDIETGARGNIKGLKGIKMHLKDVGEAITKNKADTGTLSIKKKYEKALQEEGDKKEPETPNNFPRLVSKPNSIKTPVRLQLFIKDQVYEIPFPKTLDIVQIAHIIGEVFSDKKGA